MEEPRPETTNRTSPSGRVPAPLEVPPEALASALPFSFLVDADGRIEPVGHALADRVEPGSVWSNVMQLSGWSSTEEGLDLADLAGGPGRVLELRLVASGLRLRGDLVPLAGGRASVFVGGAQLDSLAEARACGIDLDDLGAGNTAPSLLRDVQRTRAELRDKDALRAQLESALLDARAAIVAKARFLAVAGHEIRTPLNGVSSVVDLLLETALTDEQRDLLITVESSTRDLTRLLDDVLQRSELDAGEIELDDRPFRIVQVVRDATEAHRERAEGRGLRLRFIAGDDLPKLVTADRARVARVVSDLVDNAVKFTDEGGVDVHLERSGDHEFRVRVLDTGIGVTREHEPALFEPFSQGDSSHTRRHGGTGLGLSNARGLARRMGGDVVFARRDEGGSCFQFRMPYAATETEAFEADDVPAPLPAGARVLVVDDEPLNRRVALLLLSRLGLAGEAVPGGEEAIAAVAHAPYDLVLMDLMMPKLDGIETTRAIRELPVDWSGLPILAFSASTTRADRQRAKEAGLAGYMCKPIRLETFQRALERALGAA